MVFNGTLSSERLITCSLPQGSVLGPVLFLIYINNLPDAVKHSKINMFADDTAIFLNGKKSKDIEQQLNSDLHSISFWLEDNGLVLNASKSEYILITSSQKLRTVQPIQLQLDQSVIKWLIYPNTLVLWLILDFLGPSMWIPYARRFRPELS